MQETATTSIPAAAYVTAHDYKLLRLEDIGRQRYRFIFQDEDGQVARLIVGFTNGDPAPQANRFYWSLQDLRVAVNRVKHGGVL
jgi:hypothetical protein